jgi:uncharacterized membrane protein
MKAIREFVKSTLIGGLFVILPIGVLVMLVMKIVGMLLPLVSPIAARLPESLHFPFAITLVLLLLACLVAGLVAQTSAGQRAGHYFEGAFLNYLPGYAIVRNLTRRIGNVEESEMYAPAFVELEEALVPAFVVEKHTDGRYTVFVPSAPTPAVVAIYIIAKERVHLVDAPFLNAVKCVSSWGAGSAELVKAIRAPETTQP